MRFDVESYVHSDLLPGKRGGFACALAEAWCRADSGNKRTLESAFPHTFMPEAHPVEVLIRLMQMRGFEIDMVKVEELRQRCDELVKF